MCSARGDRPTDELVVCLEWRPGSVPVGSCPARFTEACQECPTVTFSASAIHIHQVPSLHEALIGFVVGSLCSSIPVLLWMDVLDVSQSFWMLLSRVHSNPL